MKFENIEVLESEKGSFIVKGKRKYVRLGENELRYLFQVKGSETNEFKFSTDYYLSDESKTLLDMKFQEWGFLDEEQDETDNSYSKFDISRIHLITINPDKFLDKIYNVGKIFFSKISIVIYLFISIVTSILIGIRAEKVSDDLLNLNYTFKSICIIFTAMLFTIMLHELGHAFVCRKYGGKVNKMGVVLFFLLPCLFCDVSDVYLFKKRKEKIFVSVAGLYVNSFLGTLSLLLYFLINNNSPVAYCFLLYYVSNLGFVIYNLIPFVKLDGYWLLSSALNVNNLITKSVVAAITSLFDIKLIMKIPISLLKKFILIIYGWIVLLFRPIFWYLSISEIYNIFDSIISDGNRKILIILIILLAVLDIIKCTSKYIKIFKKDRQRILNFL